MKREIPASMNVVVVVFLDRLQDDSAVVVENAAVRAVPVSVFREFRDRWHLLQQIRVLLVSTVQASSQTALDKVRRSFSLHSLLQRHRNPTAQGDPSANNEYSVYTLHILPIEKSNQ